MFFDHLPGAGYVCAHRGARAHAPENTLLAAQAGLDAGSDFWEMDVQRSSDGALVVFHDDTLERTTDVTVRADFQSRAPWPTTGFTLDELRSLDAGGWFADRDPYGTIEGKGVTAETVAAMRGQTIPTLNEALAFTCANDFPMNIEIKDQIHSPGDLTIVAEVLESVIHAGAEDLVLISSFNHDYLREMRRLSSSLPLAALVEKKHPDDLVDYLRSLDAVGYHPDGNITSDDLVRSLAAEGFKVSPWTVNNMDRGVAFVRANCFGVITDYPQALRERL